MTFQIRKSLLVSTDLFDIEVAAFAKEQRDWLAREAKVREEEGRTDIAPIDRHHRFPAPTAHPLIMAAVNLETGLPDYQHLDDSPSPEEVLEKRKAALMQELMSAEIAAKEAIMPTAKIRLLGIRQSAISKDDGARYKQIHSKYYGLLQKAGIKNIDHEAMMAEVRSMRSADDNAFLDDMAERHKAIEAIVHVAAHAHSDIADLTIETIDGYQLPKF